MTAAEPTAPVPRKQRRRVWAVLRWSALGLALLLVLARASVHVVLPRLLDRLGAERGLFLDYEELNLSLFGGSVELWHFDARPRDGAGPSFAHLEYLVADVDVSALLGGDLVVHRVEIDGLDVRVDRAADGTFAVARAIGAGTSEPSAAPAPEAPATVPESVGAEAPPAPLTFDVPLEVQAIRLQNVLVELHDASVTPALDLLLRLDVRVSDVGSAKRTTRLEITAAAEGLLDQLRIEGTAKAGGPSASLDLAVAMEGLRLRPVAHLLRPLGIDPRGEVIALHAAVLAQVEAPADRPGLALADLSVRDVALRSDLAEAFAIDSLEVAAAELRAGDVALPSVVLRGVRGAARSGADGTLQVAGLDLVPAAPRAREPEEAEAPAGPPPKFALGELRLEQAAFRFEDGTVAPPVALELVLDQLAIRGGSTDPARAAEPVRLLLRARLPGIADSLALQGSALPFATGRTFDLELALDGLAPERAAPYLARAGVASELRAGSLRARVSGSVEERPDGALAAAVALENVAYADGETLFGLAGVRVPEVRIAAGGAIAVTSLEIEGTELTARRGADGVLHALGFAFAAPAAPAAPADSGAAAPAPVPAAPPAAPPRVAVGRIYVHGTKATVVDQGVEPPAILALDDLAVEIEGFAFGGPPSAGAPDRADVRVSLAARDLFDSAEIRGSIATRPGPLDVALDLAVALRGLRTTAVAAYLAASGIDTSALRADLDLALRAAARQDGDALTAELSVADLALQNAGAEALAVRELSVRGVEVRGGDVRIAEILLAEPRLAVAREADGTLAFAGIRIPPAAPPGPAPASGAKSALPPAASGAPAAAAPAPQANALALGRVRVEGAAVHWADAAAAAPVATALRADVDVGGIALGGGPAAEPARLSVVIRADGALDELQIDGTARLIPTDLGAALAVRGRGLRAGPLAPYLPQNVAVSLADGRIALDLEASLGEAPDGGVRAELALSDFTLAEGDGAPLVGLRQFRVSAPRLDAAGGVFEVAEVALEGASATVRKSADGTLHAAGIAVASPAPGALPPAATVPAPPSAAADPALAAAAAPREVAELPRAVLERLSIEVERLTFVDETLGSAPVPLEIALGVTNPEPLQLLDPVPDGLPSLRLRIAASVKPLLGATVLDLEVAPFAPEPELKLDVAASGIDGSRLTEVLPALASTLDASGLTEGEFSAHFESRLELRRRSPLEFDFADGFGLEAALAGVEYRAAPGGEVLAGLGALRVDVDRIAPATGDVSIKTIELQNPTARISKQADGLHLLGLVLKPAPEAAAVTATAPPDPAAEPAGPAAAPPGPEIRVDEFLISGLDVVVRDDSVTPPMVLPLEALDLEVRRFTTRAFHEPHPIRFSLMLNSAPIELPKRDRSANALIGLAKSAVDLVGGRGAGELEQRPAFGEIAASGNLTLAPVPKGWAKLNVGSLELNTFRGPAEAAGVRIGDGVLDMSVSVRMEGERGIKLDSTTTFSDLSLSEPSDGPIARILNLKAPLETVLFLLKNEDAEHRIPVSFRVAPEGISGVQLARTATATLAEVIARAVAASPLRAAGTVTDIVGLTGSAEPEDLSRDAVAIDFLPGNPTPPAAELARLDSLLELLRSDPGIVVVAQHTIGPGDVTRAEQLSNPAADQSLQLSARLRQQKAELLRRRQQLAAAARADLLVGSAERERSTEDLRDVERELGFTEVALDRIFDLVRPGAERRRDQRTQHAALAIAELRMGALRRYLLDRGAPEDRLDFRTPRFNVDEDLNGGRTTFDPKRRGE